MMSVNFEDNKEIQIFRDYLRIPSVHPDIDYEPCLVFLRKQAESLGLSHRTIIVKNPKRPLLLMTWEGKRPELPSILLNSHMDVVPVFEEHWTYPPFSAQIVDGKIYARGAQDMKCVGTQYLAAIRALKRDGFTPERTVHITFVAEEEIGGVDCMKDFPNTDDFRALNIGFGLDEGLGSATEAFNLMYAERAIWHADFLINGKPGHGLQLFTGTVGEKAAVIMNKFNEFRQTQIELLKSKPSIGHVTSVNLTKLRGGVQSNVVPPQVVLSYDIRLAVGVDHDAFMTMLNNWCEDAGGDIQIEFEQKEAAIEPTKLDDSNRYWLAFKEAIDELGLKISPTIMPGGTDIRFVREKGIPALGFMPINNTPVLLHDHDEFLGAETYLKGIEIYKKILQKLTTFA